LTEPEYSGYGSVDSVKRLCGLATEDGYDEVLTGFLEDATTFIDLQLTNHATTPLDPVPGSIGVIANYYAAGLYLQRNMAEGKKHPHVEFAEAKLKEYIQITYVSQEDLPIVIAQDEA
jgi:phage gp36-like protein